MNPVSDAVIAENVSYTKWYSTAIPFGIAVLYQMTKTDV